jgi:hypothetical protein
MRSNGRRSALEVLPPSGPPRAWGRNGAPDRNHRFCRTDTAVPWNASAIDTLDQHNPAYWSTGAGYAGWQLDELRPAAAAVVPHAGAAERRGGVALPTVAVMAPDCLTSSNGTARAAPDRRSAAADHIIADERNGLVVCNPADERPATSSRLPARPLVAPEPDQRSVARCGGDGHIGRTVCSGGSDNARTIIPARRLRSGSCVRSPPPQPHRIGPVEFAEFGRMVAVRRPQDFAHILQRAGGLWEPGTRRWLVERRRIGPVIRACNVRRIPCSGAQG